MFGEFSKIPLKISYFIQIKKEDLGKDTISILTPDRSVRSSVRLCVRMKNLCYQRMGFYEIFWTSFRRSYEKIQKLLKSE